MSTLPRTRELVKERDLHLCVRCGKYIGPLVEHSIHHRRPRGMGGSRMAETDLPANLLLLCGSGVTGCHGWVESNRAESRLNGWLVAPWVKVPAEVPVLTHRGWARLDDHGGLELVEEPSGGWPA